MKRLFNKFSGLHGLALVMLIFVSLLFPFLEGKESKKVSITTASSYIEGLKVINRIKGDTTWTIIAKRADLSKDERIATMDSIILEIKKENITLNAERGTFDLDTKDLKLEENITLRTKGYEAKLKDLFWNPSRGLLTSDKRIALKGDRFSIEGDGLSATEEQKLRLHKNVRAIFF